MPRTRSIAWSQLKVGILAVVALGLTAGLITMVGGGGGFAWQQYALRTRFTDVQGLKEGAVVRVAGVEVGTVDSVDFAGAEVEVGLRIHKRMRNTITTASRASIGSLSLLGEATIDITPATEGTPLADGDLIPSVPPRGQLSTVADSATRSLDEATRLLRDMRAGRGTVGRLFTDDRLYREITAFVEAAEQVTASLNQSRGTLGLLLNDPAAYGSLRDTLANLAAVTDRLRRGQGSLGRLVEDDRLAASLTATAGHLDQVTARLSRGEGTAGKLLTDDALYARLNAVSARLDQVLARLDAGDGSAGQLLRDKQLYENMNGAVREMRDLLSDIRRDPKKYLNVKVSLF